MMCVGALIHARISRLIYAASEPRAGAIHSRTLKVILLIIKFLAMEAY